MRFALGVLVGLLLLTVIAVLWLFIVFIFGGEETVPTGTTSGTESGYEMRFKPCGFETPWRSEVHCAELLTPDTGAKTPQFRLPVMVIKAASSVRKTDPILYLQGGPGAPSGQNRDGVEFWLSWLEYAGVQRDLVLLDRRGTGGSEPSLDCPEYDQFSREILRDNAAFEQELEEGSAILRNCFSRLKAEGHFVPEVFGTRPSSRDVVGLMTELDYTEWNLIGVSYGSRLALAVAKELRRSGLPETVRSMILDSVYPPHHGGLLSWPKVMTEGIESFIRWCQAQSDCVDPGRDLDAELDLALEQLRRKPMRVTIELWDERRPTQIIINDHRLMSALFAAVYQKHRWPEIPRALAAVQAGEPERLQPLLEPFVNLALDESFSSLAFMAVDCRDHQLGTEQEYKAAVDEYPRFRRYLDPLWQWQSCQWLGGAEEPLRLKGDLQVPALLLAGELDPITPVAWAEELTEYWPKSQLYRVKDSGHSVISSEHCIHASLSDFLANPEKPWQPGCGER